MDQVIPLELINNTNMLLVLAGSLLLFLIVFLALFLRVQRRITDLRATVRELNNIVHQTNGKLETLIHQHTAIVDNIRSVELVVSKDVDALRHELIRQVEKIFDLSSEEFARTTEILIPRINAYKRLWEISETIYNTKTELDAAGKETVISDLNSWYFEEGNGIFLSTEASETFRKVIRALKKSSTHDIKACFSDLRIQLKNDIAVYDELDSEQALDDMTA
ncbi:MAG: hypothetical protein L0Z73_13340 [Gammaproteobacteria bacterium]|nr:hypothetical protein [Gammaproteobacteria bacterium]